MSSLKMRFQNNLTEEHQFHKDYYYEKRNITSKIEDIKQELKIIKSYDIVPTQEHLSDISERISNDVEEINHHLETIKCKIYYY